jgi:hypothetical protein
MKNRIRSVLAETKAEPKEEEAESGGISAQKQNNNWTSATPY